MLRRITVGMPVYNGAQHVAGALKCLQDQTVRDFEVIISVDGNDQATADACRPFLVDERFRMIVHPDRLDWFGNFKWLLQQPLSEFFCYRHQRPGAAAGRLTSAGISRGSVPQRLERRVGRKGADY